MRPGKTVPGYPRTPARYRLDQCGEGVRTGPAPGCDNVGIIEDAFRRADPGDVLEFPIDLTAGTENYGQLTFLDRRPTVAIPSGVELTTPNGAPATCGFVKRFWSNDWREPVFQMSSYSAMTNIIAYIHTDYYSGAAFGVIGDEDDFVISPRIVNCEATYFGDGGGRWASILSLDGVAGQYDKGGRGIRDAEIAVKGWGYFYQGAHLAGALGGDIRLTLTSMAADPAAVIDLYIGGIASTPKNLTGPGYSMIISGPSMGSVFFEDAFNVLAQGGITGATFGPGSLNNIVIAPTDFEPVLAGGSGVVNGRKYPA